MIKQPAKIRILDGSKQLDGAYRGTRLFLVLQGTLVLRTDSGERMLAEGDYDCVPDGEAASVAAGADTLFGVLSFDPELERGILKQDTHLVRASSIEDPSGAGSRIGELLRKCFVYHGHGAEEEEPLLAACEYELLYELRQHALKPRKLSIIEKKKDEQAPAAAILQYLNQHYTEALSLKDLAGITWFSEAYLSRYIRKQFGRTFTELLMDIRMEHAAERVTGSGDKLIQIALESGFSGAAALNREFQRRYGVTPSAYRREHRGDRQTEQLPEQPDEATGGELEQRVRAFMETHAEMLMRAGAEEHVLVATDGQTRELLRRFWCRMINGGTARNLLRADLQEHLTELHQNLGFSYVRIWDIWDPALMLYDRSPEHRSSYGRFDAVISFLYRHGMYPYIDLGFKPVQLVGDIGLSFIHEKRESPFETWRDYCRFIEDLLRHYARLYGDEYVENWMLELWYDPENDNIEGYLDLFEELRQRLKMMLPRIRLGGAGMSREYGDFLGTLLAAWGRRFSQPDFISVYLYPFDNGFLDPLPEDGRGNIVIYRGDDYNTRFLSGVRKLMEENGLMGAELHLSEWNSTVVNRDPLNDGIYKGAYIVRSLMQMAGRTDLAGYWFASDLHSGYYDSDALLDGSVGLLSKNGICKPSYYAFEFFNRLGNFILSSDANGIITSDASGRYRIVCHNYAHPSDLYYDVYEQRESGTPVPWPKQLLYGGAPRKLVFVIRHVPDGRYTVKTRVLDREHGSVDDEWERMERTDALDVRDIEYLRRICVPQISVRQIEVRDHRMRLEVLLTPNAIASIHVFPAV